MHTIMKVFPNNQKVNEKLMRTDITMSSHDPVHAHMISHVIISKLISLIMLNEEFTLMSGISWKSLSRDPVTAGRV